MTISVIIVNYNVKYFLEQCLYSVRAALKDITGEIIVVDNASTDKSVEYLQPKFPFVKFIADANNIGFGGGCNRGFKISSGEFVLFLNPDSIVPEDCFEKCISFIKAHPEAGAVGVKMLDGSGKFLKESKRGFPSLSASFFKLTGLSRLFPHSKLFSKYYLGHLDENKDHEADVLAGAFMMMRRNIFETVSGFDEKFFMYGEDIDLSYRIRKAGFKNYYFAGTEIIHFKGESTKRGSLDYVWMFYNAMSIFVDKHYKGSLAGFYKFFVHAGIRLMALFSAIGAFFKSRDRQAKQHNRNDVIAIAGTEEEFRLVSSLLKKVYPDQELKRVSPGDLPIFDRQKSYNELIVCVNPLSYKKVIELIKQESKNCIIKIHAAGSNSIAGSASKDTPGDAIGLDDL